MINGGFAWAVAVIVLVPFAVIAASELDERLRQRESKLRGAVSILRRWALPLFALWVVLVPVLELDADSFGVRAVESLLVVAVAVAVFRVLRVVIDAVRDRPRVDGQGPVPQLLLAVPRIVVFLLIAWLLLHAVWGVDLSAAFAALGVTSLVVSFALQDTLSGLASGMLLLSDEPFQPGDWIEFGGSGPTDTEGLVVDINWRTTHIRTRNGDMMIVPNSQLANASIVNYSAPEPLHRVVVGLQVAYANPPTLAKEMLLDAARGVAGVLEDPPPDVKVVSIDDPLMGYEVQMWISDYSDAPRVKSDFGALVWYQSHRHGVPLPSPAQDLFLHDAAAAAAAAEPDPLTIRQAIEKSALLGMLGDADIDRLVAATRPARFAAGELMVESGSSRRDMMMLVDGRAVLVLIEPGHDDAVVGELASGETVGILESPRGDLRSLAARAITDCEVLIVEASAASEIGSRNADLAAAFNRLSEIRARRVGRLIAAREIADPTDTVTPGRTRAGRPPAHEAPPGGASTAGPG